MPDEPHHHVRLELFVGGNLFLLLLNARRPIRTLFMMTHACERLSVLVLEKRTRNANKLITLLMGNNHGEKNGVGLWQ